MNPYGNYGIYFLDIFGSFGATLAAYYLGVLAVLTIGWQIGRIFVKLTTHKHKEIKTGELLQPDEDRDDLSMDNGQMFEGQVLAQTPMGTESAVAQSQDTQR